MRANLLPSFYCLLSISLAAAPAVRSAHADAPANRISTPKQSDASADSNIQVESWTKPKPGWLYVLDPKPGAGGPRGRVWLVDPETGKVMGSIRTGDNADFALSPDGSRLYVASITDGDSSELAAIDTAQGVVLQRGTVDDREVGNVLPSFSTMAVSGDGLALRILRDTPESADRDLFLLATFDTQTGEFLSKNVRLYNCGPGRFISHPSADQFDILCPRSNRIRLISVDADSRELQNVDIKFPWERRIGVAEAIEPFGTQGVAIIRGDGAVFKMDLVTHEFSETSAHFELPNRVPPAAWPVSPDGSRIYVGYNRDYDRSYDNRFYLDYGRPPNLRPNNATAGEFRVLDTQTWRKIGTIKTKMHSGAP
jgi:DNA-binding beta-propeller fold protein YncE